MKIQMKFFCLLMFNLNVFANAAVVVERLQGEVFFNKAPLALNSVIAQDGVITTSENSFVKIRNDLWGSQLIVGPNSEMQLQLSAPDKKDLSPKAILDKGFLRFRTFNEQQRSQAPKIETPQAAMAVRGTDFLVISTRTLGETEIVVFEGLVQFENAADEKNNYTLKAGQWGGIGGRFTTKIQAPLDLPAAVLENFSRRLDL